MNLYYIVGGSQLYGISTNSESVHVTKVRSILEAYNAFPESYLSLNNGEYAFNELQTLYNVLYSKGSQSLQDAFEVGCMVEVTDIMDLNNAIDSTSNIDILNMYSQLLNGSFSHYDSFDQGLKDLGIVDGCCSLGSEYCFN